MFQGYVATICCSDVSHEVQLVQFHVTRRGDKITPKLVLHNYKSISSHEETCRCNIPLKHVPATFSCVCTCCNFVAATCPCNMLRAATWPLVSAHLNERSFVFVNQHGGDDVTWKPPLYIFCKFVWSPNKPDEGWYWPAEMSSKNILSRCFISRAVVYLTFICVNCSLPVPQCPLLPFRRSTRLTFEPKTNVLSDVWLKTTKSCAYTDPMTSQTKQRINSSRILNWRKPMQMPFDLAWTNQADFWNYRSDMNKQQCRLSLTSTEIFHGYL